MNLILLRVSSEVALTGSAIQQVMLGQKDDVIKIQIRE